MKIAPLRTKQQHVVGKMLRGDQQGPLVQVTISKSMAEVDCGIVNDQGPLRLETNPCFFYPSINDFWPNLGRATAQVD